MEWAAFQCSRGPSGIPAMAALPTRSASAQREELFRIVTENAADMIALVDVKGHRLYNSLGKRHVGRDCQSRHRASDDHNVEELEIEVDCRRGGERQPAQPAQGAGLPIRTGIPALATG